MQKEEAQPDKESLAAFPKMISGDGQPEVRESLVTLQKLASVDGDRGGTSLRSRRENALKLTSETSADPSHVGHHDVLEIEKLLSGRVHNKEEKEVLSIIEKASDNSAHLNYLFHHLDVEHLLVSVADGMFFKARTALLHHLSQKCLNTLDFQSKHKICAALWKRNKDGVEQQVLDKLLLSIDRVNFELGSLGMAWQKAHQRCSVHIQLSPGLIATAHTASLAQRGLSGALAQVSHEAASDGAKLIDTLAAFVLSHLPHNGTGVRLEEQGGFFDEFLVLLGLHHTDVKSRLDLAGHLHKYPDAVAFVDEIVKSLKRNAVVVAFLAEWERLPVITKANAFPPSSPERAKEIQRALVYCFFLDIMVHSMMFEKPADVEPVLPEGEELLIETLTRVTTAALYQTEWWRYWNFSEQIQLAAVEHAWEKDYLPFKRAPFPATRNEEQKHQGEILKINLFEHMYRDVLRECEDNAAVGLALVLGTLHKGSNAIHVPDLGNIPWRESVMQPRGRRAVEGETCRMGFGAEFEALSPVWENLFMSWRLNQGFTESDGILIWSQLLAPTAGSFYQSMEGSGLFLTFRTPGKWLHMRVMALMRAQRKKIEPGIDWRSPITQMLWAKVNHLAANQYVTRLHAVIDQQPAHIQEELKTTQSNDQASWARIRSGLLKQVELKKSSTHLEWVERTTRLFWKIVTTSCHPDSVLLHYEKEVFARGTHRHMGATSKTCIEEPDEKSLIHRDNHDLIDADFYNARLKEEGVPVLEDLLFDRNGVRSKALGNQVRIGTILIDILCVKLVGRQRSPLHCVLETTLTPRDGKFQGSVHTAPSETGEWTNESFILPLSSRVLNNNASMAVEVWHEKTLLGFVRFSLEDLRKHEVEKLSEERGHFTTEKYGLTPENKEEKKDVGTIELRIQLTLAPKDPLCNRDKHERLPDGLVRSTWPGKFSFGKLAEQEIVELRTTLTGLIPKLKTGDLILWASSLHKGDFATRLMNSAMHNLTDSIYTHAAIVYVTTHPTTKERLLFHVEAGVNRLLNVDCISLTPFRNSIFITDLRERMENYGASMVILPLKKALSPVAQEHVSRFIAHLWLRDPAFGSSQLVTAGLGKAHVNPVENTEEWSQLFCSEFVSASYKLAGIPEFHDVNTATLAPADVATKPIFKKRLVLTALAEHLRHASLHKDFAITLAAVRSDKFDLLDAPADTPKSSPSSRNHRSRSVSKKSSSPRASPRHSSPSSGRPPELRHSPSEPGEAERQAYADIPELKHIPSELDTPRLVTSASEVVTLRDLTRYRSSSDLSSIASRPPEAKAHRPAGVKEEMPSVKEEMPSVKEEAKAEKPSVKEEMKAEMSSKEEMKAPSEDVPPQASSPPASSSSANQSDCLPESASTQTSPVETAADSAFVVSVSSASSGGVSDT